MFLSSSFSDFSPSMPVPLGQLSSADSGVVTTSASSAAVCTVTFTVAGLAVHGSEGAGADVGELRGLVSFQKVYAMAGPSSASQPPLVTPPVVSVPGPSSMLTTPAAAALSMNLRLVASSSRLAERHWTPSSSGSSAGSSCSRTCDPSGGRLQSRGLSLSRSWSHSQAHHPSGGRQLTRDPSASRSRSRSRTRPCLKAVITHRTRRPAIPGPVTCPGAVHYNGTRLPPGPGPGLARRLSGGRSFRKDLSTTHSRSRALASLSSPWVADSASRSSSALIVSGARLHLEVRATAQQDSFHVKCSQPSSSGAAINGESHSRWILFWQHVHPGRLAADILILQLLPVPIPAPCSCSLVSASHPSSFRNHSRTRRLQCGIFMGWVACWDVKTVPDVFQGQFCFSWRREAFFPLMFSFPVLVGGGGAVLAGLCVFCG